MKIDGLDRLIAAESCRRPFGLPDDVRAAIRSYFGRLPASQIARTLSEHFGMAITAGAVRYHGEAASGAVG